MKPKPQWVNLIKQDLNTAGTAGIQACGDGTSGLREILIKVLSAKQEGNAAKFSTEAPSFMKG